MAELSITALTDAILVIGIALTVARSGGGSLGRTPSEQMTATPPPADQRSGRAAAQGDHTTRPGPAGRIISRPIVLSSPGAYCVALHDHRRSAKSRTFAIRLGGGYDWARQGRASGPATVGKQRPPPIPRVGGVQAVQKQRGVPAVTERTRRPVRTIGGLCDLSSGPGNSCWHAGHRAPSHWARCERSSRPPASSPQESRPPWRLPDVVDRGASPNWRLAPSVVTTPLDSEAC